MKRSKYWWEENYELGVGLQKVNRPLEQSAKLRSRDEFCVGVKRAHLYKPTSNRIHGVQLENDQMAPRLGAPNEVGHERLPIGGRYVVNYPSDEN